MLLTGLLLAAAFPPSPLGPLVFVAFVPLLVLLETLEIKGEKERAMGWLRRRWSGGYARAFRYTYLAFLLWNVLCCYWLTLTMVGANDLSEGLEYFMGGFMAITVNPLLMSLPWLLFMRARRRFGPVWAAALLVPLWLAFEHLHFRWDLTWSWLTIGHSLTMYAPFLQHAEFTGVGGVGLHIMVANVLVYLALRHRQQLGRWSRRHLAIAAAWVLLPLALLPLIMRPGRAVFQDVGTMAVRIVQPNIDPYEKFEEDSRSRDYGIFHRLASAPGADTIHMVLLPETALTHPGGLDARSIQADSLCGWLWADAEKHNYSILSGLIERRIFTDPATAPASATQWGSKFIDTYNAAVMMSPGAPPEFYQKIKLVPFVERFPFLEAAHDLMQRTGIDLTMGFGGYGLPDSLRLLHTNRGVPIGTLICYESEFTDVARHHVQRGAQALVVVTNDGWWGKSSGYIQHAYLSRLRAIETRRDIARSANTGRSLFVDARGRISHTTPYWEETFVDGTLRRRTAVTFHTRMGDYVGAASTVISICLILALILFAILRRTHQPRQPNT